jgi:uncharacterized protein
MPDAPEPRKLFRILSLDGGGAKGFYTLGILHEIEAMLGGKPLCKSFQVIYGTSTGSIIASLLALGHSVDEIYKLYCDHVPTIMSRYGKREKTRALRAAAAAVFKKQNFSAFKTDIGIVATHSDIERPLIFKTREYQAFGRREGFVAGFGCTIADAVVASCSAYPFFEKTSIDTANNQHFELIDGGYCANNPTLYAIAEATAALEITRSDLRVVSLGVAIRRPICASSARLGSSISWRVFSFSR